HPGRRANGGNIDGDAIGIDLLLDPGHERRRGGELIMDREGARKSVELAKRRRKRIIGLGLNDNIPIREAAFVLGSIDALSKARLLFWRDTLECRSFLSI